MQLIKLAEIEDSTSGSQLQVSKSTTQQLDITSYTINENSEVQFTINLLVDDEYAKNVPIVDANQETIIDLNPTFLNNSYNLVKNNTDLKSKETLATYLSNFDEDLSLKSSPPSSTRKQTDLNNQTFETASQQSRCSCCCTCGANTPNRPEKPLSAVTPFRGVNRENNQTKEEKLRQSSSKKRINKKYQKPKRRVKTDKLRCLKRRSIVLKPKLQRIFTSDRLAYDAEYLDDKVKGQPILLGIYNGFKLFDLCKGFLSVLKNFDYEMNVGKKNKSVEGEVNNGDEKSSKKNKVDELQSNDSSKLKCMLWGFSWKLYFMVIMELKLAS